MRCNRALRHGGLFETSLPVSECHCTVSNRAYVPPPNLNNTDRIQQLLHDGKIMLSMNDAVALRSENNLDLVLARYNLNIADTDIMRADAGANILGVNTGIVQNTPGGGVGGLSGTCRLWNRRHQRSRGRHRHGHKWFSQLDAWASARLSPASIPSSAARCRWTGTCRIHQHLCPSSTSRQYQHRDRQFFLLTRFPFGHEPGGRI